MQSTKKAKRNRKHKSNAQVVRIALEEWTKDDGLAVANFTLMPTFNRVKSILHGYLVNALLQGADQEYRKGYLAAINDFTALGTASERLADSEDFSSMQERAWEE